MVVASVQTIAENHLVPVIAQMLAQYPFRILGFRADNGSEYVNYRVAAMLEKLRIEFMSTPVEVWRRTRPAGHALCVST